MAAVPKAPGVPALLTGWDIALSAALTLKAVDSVLGLGIFGAEEWGIFLNGQNAIPADTMLSFEYRKDSQISDYPLEGGKFESYNKVAVPFDVRVKLACGGNDAARRTFLGVIESLVDDYNLYDAITPEKVYTSCNIVHHDYTRTMEQGRGVLAVNLWLRQVRISSGNAAPNTAFPSGAPQVNGGSVQGVTPSVAQAAKAAFRLW
jgi:hypothetical protein